LWRLAAEIERPLGEEPFGVRERLLGECLAQRRDPGVVFVDDVDAGRDGFPAGGSIDRRIP
jgi:hypothetical protein